MRVGSLEFMEWLAACEAEFGFVFEVISEPGQDPYLSGSVSSSQQALHSEVRAACMDLVVESGRFFRITNSAEDAPHRVPGVSACSIVPAGS